jgi:predicted amidohydrolase
MPGTSAKPYNYGLQPMIDDGGTIVIQAGNAAGTGHLAGFKVTLDSVSRESALDLLQVAFFHLIESMSEGERQAYLETLTGEDDED